LTPAGLFDTLREMRGEMRVWRGPVHALLGLAALLATVVAAPAAEPFWGDKQSRPPETDPATLKPGQFIWEGDAVTAGPIVVVVSLADQRADAYRNGVRIGVTTVSTGKRGHDTPTGVFTILQKDKDHRSSLYNDAPMPYTERLTWGGVALHAGGLPGYPSSHGCVHLPSEFARLLFGITERGITVVIADEHSAPAEVVHPAALAPVDASSGKTIEVPRLSPDEPFRWQPEKAPDGPVTVLVSAADKRVLVSRDGVEIGRARIAIDDPSVPLGTHAFVALAAGTGAQDGARPRWVAIGIPGHMGEAKRALDPRAADRVHFPPAFLADVRPLVTPGVTMLVTDSPVLESTTGPKLTIMHGGAPAES